MANLEPQKFRSTQYCFLLHSKKKVPLLKGALSRQSSSFCLILITRPQSLWNLKCGSPNDVTFSLFCVSHYHKVQVFIQPLQILISANERKIYVGLSVPTNSLTTFNSIKREFNWHEPTNRQPANFVGFSVPTSSLTNFDLIKQEFNWHEPTNRQPTNFVGLSVPTNSLTNFNFLIAGSSSFF